MSLYHGVKTIAMVKSGYSGEVEMEVNADQRRHGRSE